MVRRSSARMARARGGCQSVPVTTVTLAPYRRVLSRPSLRRTLLLGTLTRAPMFATGILVTVHVVTTLGRSYVMAGLVAAAVTTAVAISGPWRGRLLDRHGLRAVVGPSLVVSGTCWGLAPWVGLLAAARPRHGGRPLRRPGLLGHPAGGHRRRSRTSDRRTAISLDSAAIELSFMVAPGGRGLRRHPLVHRLGALRRADARGRRRRSALWLADPPLRVRGGRDAVRARARPHRDWLRGPFLAVLVMVARDGGHPLRHRPRRSSRAMRGFGQTPMLGLVLAALGARLARRRPRLRRPAPRGPGALAARGPRRRHGCRWRSPPRGVALAVLACVAGLLCAPTITATRRRGARIVPAEVRGEAMGWHGSALTAGGALGAPFAGLVIDQYGGGWRVPRRRGRRRPRGRGGLHDRRCPDPPASRRRRRRG